MIDQSLPNLDRLPEHRKLLERADARLRDDARVVGLLVGGSLAHDGVADSYSDIDLYILVRKGAFDEIFAERSNIAEAVGSPLFRFDVDPMPGGSTDHIVIFEGPVKFDFMYLKETDLCADPKWAGGVVLTDPSGLLKDVVIQSQSLTPRPPTPEALLDLNQKFWIWCWYAFGKIVRGELWEALDGLHSIRSLALVPLLDQVAERRHEGFRRLERKADPATLSRLAATVAPMEPGALYAALLVEIELFRGLRATVFDRHGLAYDPVPEEVLVDEMSQRWVAREAR